VRTNKENFLTKLTENHKKLNVDIETQKEVKKKVEEIVNEQTKQYNEMVKSINK